jgi:RNA polymerase sigma-70 factor (ECF subfamily)
VLGFDAANIASAFLIAPSAMSQRLVRAKAKIRDARIPFRVPDRAELAERLEPVLSAIYAAYSEGWSDPDGSSNGCYSFAEEAIWLGRLLVSLLPEEAEALGLLALMLHTEARRAARRKANGDYVPLSEQDSKLWNSGLIEEAERLLFRARSLGTVGRYQLEAAVQSAHAIRRFTEISDWSAIEQLYDAHIALTGSPVAAINRAVAIAEIRGSAAGLVALDEIAADPRVQQYQPYWAARAELLGRTGNKEMAREAYQQAIGLEADPAIRRFLQRQVGNLFEVGVRHTAHACARPRQRRSPTEPSTDG